NKIYISLIAALIIVGGVVFWGTSQNARFDVLSLEEDGTVLNKDYETVQFSKKDTIYRNWNSEQVILTNDETEKNVMSDSSMLIMNSGSLMFLQQTPNIDVSGVSRNTDARSVYKKTGTGFRNDYNNEIVEKEVVKLANRQYFVAGSGSLYVDGELVGEATDPLLLVDKTGSVTALVDNGTRKDRYIGHFVFVLDDTHRVDVSDEKYYVEDTVIDLSKYGGTDNEKLVINEEEELDEEDTTVDGGGNEGNGTGEGTGNGNMSSDEAAQAIKDLPSVQSIEELNALIEQINQSSTNKVPIVELTSKKVTATGLRSNLFVSDPSNTLVGQLQFDVLNSSGEVVKTYFENGRASTLDISGLQINTSYSLRLSYQYDLGNGMGVQTNSVTAVTFTTQNVSAIYSFSDIAATSFSVDVSLDSVIDNIRSSKLLVYKADGTLVNTIDVDPSVLNAGGSRVVVRDVTENTAYKVVLKVKLQTGEDITFKDSRQVTTYNSVSLRSYSLNRSQMNQYNLEYDLSLYDYQVDSVSIELSTTSWFQTKTIPVEIIKKTDTEISFIPLLEEESNGINAVVRFSLKSSDSNQKKDFTYDIGNLDFKNDNQLVYNAFFEGVNSTEIFTNYSGKLLFYFKDYIEDSEYQIVFEKKIKDEYEKIATINVSGKNIKNTEIGTYISEYNIEDEYRVVVYDSIDGIVNYTYLNT
ncbi:MAG: hypothetical protein ACK5LC_07245, partial [Coprobacillaceae bacterium]